MLDDYSENFRLAIYLSGKTQPNSWNNQAVDYTFFDLKGEVNAILKKLGLFDSIETTDTQWEVFEEGIDLNIKNKTLVHLGIVNRGLIGQFDIKGQVFYADFDWDYLFSLLKTGHIHIADLPKFPAVRRDLSLLLDKAVAFKAIRDLAFKTERKLLKSVELFDVYEGKGMESGKKSYAVSFILQDAAKTLNDKVIDKTMNRIQQNLEKELGARLRG